MRNKLSQAEIEYKQDNLITPCEEAQDCGWTCNDGHLCDWCNGSVRVKKAITKKEKEFIKMFNMHIDYDCLAKESKIKVNDYFSGLRRRTKNK